MPFTGITTTSNNNARESSLFISRSFITRKTLEGTVPTAHAVYIRPIY